jgi:hypothetical protein
VTGGFLGARLKYVHSQVLAHAINGDINALGIGGHIHDVFLDAPIGYLELCVYRACPGLGGNSSNQENTKDDMG